MKKPFYLMLSNLCFVLGFASIIASIYIWVSAGGNAYGAGAPSSLMPMTIIEQRAYAERFGIFVGLWAPTFFILSNRLKLSAHA